MRRGWFACLTRYKEIHEKGSGDVVSGLLLNNLSSVCIVLYCTILYFYYMRPGLLVCLKRYLTVFYCIILLCSALYYSVLYCTLLYTTVLSSIVLYTILLYITVQYCTALSYTLQHRTKLHCTELY